MFTKFSYYLFCNLYICSTLNSFIGTVQSEQNAIKFFYIIYILLYKILCVCKCEREEMSTFENVN